MFLRTDYQANIIEDSKRETVLHLTAEISASTEAHYSSQPLLFQIPICLIHGLLLGCTHGLEAQLTNGLLVGPKPCL